MYFSSIMRIFYFLVTFIEMFVYWYNNLWKLSETTQLASNFLVESLFDILPNRAFTITHQTPIFSPHYVLVVALLTLFPASICALLHAIPTREAFLFIVRTHSIYIFAIMSLVFGKSSLTHTRKITSLWVAPISSENCTPQSWIYTTEMTD